MSTSDLMKRLKAQAKTVVLEASNGGFEKTDWFKPELGENTLRFLPHWSKPDEVLPWVTVRLHFVPKSKASGGTVNIPARCLSDFDEQCPMCQAHDRIMKTNKDEARAYRANTQYLYNVMNYRERKVQPYAAGATVHQQLMGWVSDIDGNLFDIENGYDFKLIKTQLSGVPKMVGTKYALRPILKPSAIPAKLQPLLSEATDLDKMYSQNERQAMLEFLGTTTTNDEDTDEIPFAPTTSEKLKTAAVLAAKAAAARATAKSAVVVAGITNRASVSTKKTTPKVEEDIDEEVGGDSDDDLERELRELGV